MSKAICRPSIYSTICMVIIIALSYVISQDISCKLVTDVSGTDNKVKTSNNHECLSFDNRQSKDGGEQCNTWRYLGIETFEFMAIGVLAIFLIYKGGKKICGKKGILEKRRESKLQREAAKFEKLRIRFEKPGAVIERDDFELKGHVTENCKGPVRELNAGNLKQLPPFILEA